MTDRHPPLKPLGHRSYGSIGHLPGSRRGPADRGINDGQARICLERARDSHDRIIVQEKLDGSNVSVAKINGAIVPLIRAGYLAIDSRWEQHQYFAAWALERWDRFDRLLNEGERVCGEWLAQAHSTRYAIEEADDAFVAFDIMRGQDRVCYSAFFDRATSEGILAAKAVHVGAPVSIDDALSIIGDFGRYGALDIVEGAVWRVERMGKVDFLAKYVRPGKVDGCYFPEVTGGNTIWNWKPGAAEDLNK